MTGPISKRQQARNERMLQDLLRSVPGNDRCADCAAKNPGWASWNLGVFLCMRCAALHRKLGTHVSKVKSLSMDSWSVEQVENMKKIGNGASNRLFNPSNVRPDIPIDADEVDAAIEKYIRQKYDTRTLSGNARSITPAARQNSGSTGTGTGSWSEEPPDLPPKPTKRFGFTLRSSSAAVVRQRNDRITPPLSPAYTGSDRSADLPSPKASKPSRLFGMKITTVDNNFNAKLTHLRDMGFDDNAKNTEMLKSMNGNLDRAIEALIRLGEGSKPITRSVTPGPRALTPVSMGSFGANGLSIEKKSSNPWEIREKPSDPIQRSISVPPQSTAPASNSWNPFLQPPQTQQQPQQSLENGFQTLSMSATSSPGPQSHGVQQAYYQNTTGQQGSNPWQQQQVLQGTQQQQTMDATYGQQYWQAPAVPQTNTSSNPFMQQQQQQQSQSQALSPSNPWAQQTNPWSQQPAQQQASAVQQPSNPFGTSWQQQSFSQQPVASPQPIYSQQTDFFAQPQQSAQQQQPSQQQSQFQPQQQSQPAQQQFAAVGQNPWQQQTHQHTSMPQQEFQNAQAQPPAQQTQPSFDANAYHQQFANQQASKHDKSSILALYSQPQLAPPRALQTLPEDGTMATQQSYDMPQRSVTMPNNGFGGNMNPFGHVQTQQQVPQHRPNESRDFQGFAGSGRHSPDAFAGLSAQYMR